MVGTCPDIADLQVLLPHEGEQEEARKQGGVVHQRDVMENTADAVVRVGKQDEGMQHPPDAEVLRQSVRLAAADPARLPEIQRVAIRHRGGGGNVCASSS